MHYAAMALVLQKTQLFLFFLNTYNWKHPDASFPTAILFCLWTMAPYGLLWHAVKRDETDAAAFLNQWLSVIFCGLFLLASAQQGFWWGPVHGAYLVPLVQWPLTLVFLWLAGRRPRTRTESEKTTKKQKTWWQGFNHANPYLWLPLFKIPMAHLVSKTGVTSIVDVLILPLFWSWYLIPFLPLWYLARRGKNTADYRVLANVGTVGVLLIPVIYLLACGATGRVPNSFFFSADLNFIQAALAFTIALGAYILTNTRNKANLGPIFVPP
ncbi:hypothetical protein [Acanthopleuribacter pedis]|uniref:Uncharacterized protein n=1 Tax=Acanthopleuribacter pedis TaxID=442870 RepID=A0A8J7U6F9_9BACT|nr:hypothetical protein [Acanthopleuribacter pedis]MBO1322742.1 hypothetical protein [Acanthopleuribacter pedis]